LPAADPRDMDQRSSKLLLDFAGAGAAAAGVDVARVLGFEMGVARMGGEVVFTPAPKSDVWFWLVYVGVAVDV